TERFITIRPRGLCAAPHRAYVTYRNVTIFRPEEAAMTSTLTHPADPAARSHDDDPLRLLVLVGSVREGRFGPVPARWIAGVADTPPDIEAQRAELPEST